MTPPSTSTAARAHALDSRTCWCNPTFERECPEYCEEDPDCWLCGGEGWIPATGTELEALIIIHSDETEFAEWAETDDGEALA